MEGVKEEEEENGGCSGALSGVEVVVETAGEGWAENTRKILRLS